MRFSKRNGLWVVASAGAGAAVGVVCLTALRTNASNPTPQVPQEPPIVHPPVNRRPPMPPMPVRQNVSVQSVTVNGTVRDGVAETEVTHVIANNTGTPQEADFLFPIPAGASVSSFAMYDGETKMDARLLDKDEATATYEDIVRRRKDPALLTFQGRAALRARVFPIAPNSTRRITLKLVTVLPREGDAKKYVWTLIGPHLPGSVRPEHVSVRVTMEGSQSIGNVYSPTHEVRIRRDSDTKVVVNWESDKNDAVTLAENPEFSLFVAPKKGGDIALSALTYNAALPQVASLTGGARQSGYFLIVASPALADAARNAIPRHVVVVMDRSGSMQGKKIDQAKSALRFALGKLRPMDTFNVITFSDKVEKFSPEQVAATPENLKRAGAFVDDIVADGGTNINQALQDGIAQFPEKGSGNTLLFFTDGLPTVGVRSQDMIVENAVGANAKKARTFVFGVGYDVDVPFLDNVARSLRGDADYVRPDEDIEVKTSQFVAKTSAPVLENLKVTVNGARTGDIYPKPDDIPDLFAGSQLVLVGRYTGVGNNVNVTLTGEANGKPQTFSLGTTFPAVDTKSDFLPRLWASRKIGYLMDEVRLRKEADVKQELIAQIKELSKEYGVLTPYTALFVPEPGGDRVQFGLQEREARPNVAFGRARGNSGGFGGGGAAGPPMDANGMYDAAKASTPVAASPASRSGEAAVNASQASRAQRYQVTVGNARAVGGKDGFEKKRDAEMAKRIQNIASRTFYQQGAQWTDATYDAKKQKQIVKVKLYSPAYFALTRRNADFARWAALGDQVLIAANATQAVQFGSDGKEALTDSEVKALAGK
jgi:Ca-activated chloride channel family protein